MSFGAVGQITAAVAVIAWLVVLSVVDLREHRLPNALTLPGAAVILTIAAVGGRGLPAAAGAAALAGAYLVVHLVAPAAMGAGDVKLALGLGALTGALSVDIWALAALGAPVLTAGWGLVSGQHRVPHGPSMCLATALVIWAC
jgi:leader peptidase (prepilin peptidase)/N-methyltransferase